MYDMGSNMYIHIVFIIYVYMYRIFKKESAVGVHFVFSPWTKYWGSIGSVRKFRKTNEKGCERELYHVSSVSMSGMMSLF